MRIKMLSDNLKQYALLNPLRTTYLFLQQVSPAEARGSLDWQCLQTIFEVEKSALEMALKEQDWHILRIQKELDSPEGSSIAAGKNLLQEYLESWSEEKQKTLHSLGKAGVFAGELAYSAFLDKKYGETKNYLFLAEEIYQSLKVKDPESKIAEGRLTQLAKVADLIVQYIQESEQSFSPSRENYFEAAAECARLGCVPDQMQELRCAETAPSRYEQEREKSKRLTELEEKIKTLFDGKQEKPL